MIIGAVSISELESKIDYATEIKREWYESGVGEAGSNHKWVISAKEFLMCRTEQRTV